MNPDGNGAMYWPSESIRFYTKVPLKPKVITPPYPDIIAGILAQWVGLSSPLASPSKLAR
jgi:hypothetical protein